MKTLIIIAISVILMLTSCNNHKIKNDLTKIDLIGKVKSVREISYEAIEKFGEISKGNIEREGKEWWNEHEYIKEFNENGYLTKVITFKSDGSFFGGDSWKYDKFNNMIESNILSDDGSVFSKRIWKYNNYANKTEMNVYNSDGELEYNDVWKYDHENNLIEYYRDKVDEGLEMKTIYTYDKFGNKIGQKTSGNSGNLQYTKKWNYNANGNAVEEIVDNEGGYDDYKYFMKYDKYGNQIEQFKQKNNGEKKLNFKKEFNSDSYIINKTTFNSDGSRKSMKTWNRNKMNITIEYINYKSKRGLFYRALKTIYDNNGNKKERIKYNPNGSVNIKQTYSYEFDKQGNWVKRIDYKNNKPIYLLEREIDYYNN